MSTRVYGSLARIADFHNSNFEITELPRSEWATGDYVQGEVTGETTALYIVEDMAGDPQYNARDMFEQVDAPGGRMTIPAIAPKLERTPGFTSWAGPDVGTSTEEILLTLGYDAAAIKRMAADGDI